MRGLKLNLVYEPDWNQGVIERAVTASLENNMNQPVKDPDAPFGHKYGPYIEGVFSPLASESTFEDLPVTGTIPTDLNGVLSAQRPQSAFRAKG